MKRTIIALTALLATVSSIGLSAYADEPTTGQPAAQPEKPKAEPKADAPQAEPAKEAKLVWYGVKDGFDKAKAENKPIIVDFFTDWCGWCKKMDRDTYENADVVKELSSRFIMVKADAENKRSGGQQLAQNNGINAFPTVMIFDSQGQPKDNIVGYKGPAAFLKIIKEYLAQSAK